MISTAHSKHAQTQERDGHRERESFWMCGMHMKVFGFFDRIDSILYITEQPEHPTLQTDSNAKPFDLFERVNVCVCASKSETKIERRNKMPVILIVKHFNRISIVFNLLHLRSVLCVRLWQCFPSHLLVQANYIQPSAVLWYPVQWHVLLSKIWHFKNIYISKNKSLRFDVHADASHRNI